MPIRQTVVRTHPELWEVCKEEAVFKLGKFSARAMQHAVLLYKERGGGYGGTKKSDNALVVWSKKEEQKLSRKTGILEI
jgi:preprotein translocase subunit SecG